MRCTQLNTLIAAACGMVVMFNASVTAQNADILRPAPDAQRTVTVPAHATDLRNVRVDLDRLRLLDTQDVFSLTLYDEALTAVVERVEPKVVGRTIVGRFEDVPGSRFIVTVVDDAIAGWFYFASSGRTVRLRYGGNGLHYLHRLDSALMQTCAGGLNWGRPERALGRGGVRGNEPRAAGGWHWRNDETPTLPLSGCAPLDPTFDIMIVYSDDARAEAGGTAAVQAEAINAVEVTELTYLTCSTIIRTNIVFLAEVAYDESDSSYEDHLNRLTDPDDGILDGVHDTRDIVGADFVSLFVADDESGGLGWCMATDDEAFSIVRWGQATDSFTLAHEVGHNIGCAHNPEDADCELTDFGYGNNFFVPDEDMWRHTVMAYSLNGSTEIPYYSTPDCFYEGVATGSPTVTISL